MLSTIATASSAKETNITEVNCDCLDIDMHVDHKKNKRQVSYIQRYCILVLVASLLTPAFRIAAGLPAIHLADLLLLLAPFYIGKTTGYITFDLRSIIIIAITCSITASILWGSLLGFQASLLDLFFLVRMAKYFCATILAFALVRVMGSSEQALQWFLQRFVKIGLFLGVIVIQQYYNLFHLNALYIKYVAPTQYRTLLVGYSFPRPVGMIGNPNALGFLLGLLCVSSIWLYFTEHTRTNRWATFGIIYFILMGLTLSRSSVFSMTIALTIFSFFFQFRTFGKFFRFRTFFIVILSLVIASLLITKTDLVEQVVWRFTADKVETSYKVRANKWLYQKQLIEKSPLLGIGILNRSDEASFSADNEWLLLRRIGGIPLVLLVILLFTSGSIKKRNQSSDGGRILIIAITSASFFYMIPAAIFFNLVMMPLVIMILVLASPTPKYRIKINP
jgi:hypothetical protein